MREDAATKAGCNAATAFAALRDARCTAAAADDGLTAWNPTRLRRSLPPAMNLITTLGLAAGVLTTAAFVPQVVRVWRTRCTRDLSATMLLVLAAGVALWIAYGILTASLPVVAANALTLILVVAILVAKLKYG